MSSQTLATIRTYRTGRDVSLLWPDADAIAIEDIACALSRQCRFVGHTAWHYSVAQHSIAASHLVPDDAALWALLHDAPEAYLGDVSAPLKGTPIMARYRALEGLWESAIAWRFSLRGQMPACVKTIDQELCDYEMAVLFKTGTAIPARVHQYLLPWPPETAESRFLARFAELTAERH